jgi:hypothetical protein
MSKLIVVVAALSIGGLIFAAGPARGQLTGQDRADFVAASFKSCMGAIQKKHPDNPEAANTTYCTCMSNREVDIMTSADVAYINEHHAASEDYTQRVAALAPECNAAAGLH